MVGMMVALIGAFIVFLVVLWWWTEGDILGMCDSTHLDEVRSPSGARKVEIFNYDCGATTGFTTNLAVIESRHPMPKTNRKAFFVAEESDDTKVETYEQGGPKVGVKWTSERSIEVRHSKEIRVFRAAETADDLRITYLPD